MEAHLFSGIEGEKSSPKGQGKTGKLKLTKHQQQLRKDWGTEPVGSAKVS